MMIKSQNQDHFNANIKDVQKRLAGEPSHSMVTI